MDENLLTAMKNMNDLLTMGELLFGKEKEKLNMNEEKKFIPKGKIFIGSAGEYSDYGVIFICRALKDIYVDNIRKEFLDNEKMDKYGYYNIYQFCNWLVINGYAEEYEYDELHIDNYPKGNIDLELK